MGLYDLQRKQAKLLEVLINPESYKKTAVEICKEAGIARPTYYKYIKDENFIKALNDARVDILKTAVLPIVNRMVKSAKQGNFQSAKMILEMAGAYNPKLVHEGNEENPIKFYVNLLPEGTND